MYFKGYYLLIMLNTLIVSVHLIFLHFLLFPHFTNESDLFLGCLTCLTYTRCTTALCVKTGRFQPSEAHTQVEASPPINCVWTEEEKSPTDQTFIGDKQTVFRDFSVTTLSKCKRLSCEGSGR